MCVRFVTLNSKLNVQFYIKNNLIFRGKKTLITVINPCPSYIINLILKVIILVNVYIMLISVYDTKSYI